MKRSCDEEGEGRARMTRAALAAWAAAAAYGLLKSHASGWALGPRSCEA